MKVRVEHGNMFGADEKSCGEGRHFSQLETSAIDDHEGAQFSGLVIGVGIRLGRRQKNGANKHGQANDGRNEASPKTKRHNHQGRSADSQENAEEHPGAGIAPRVQYLWNEQHQGEESSDSKMTKPLAETLRLGNRWVGCDAHL